MLSLLPIAALCFWAISLLSVLLFYVGHAFSIRIILPKNSKSKCSIFPYILSVLHLFSVLRSFFSSAFYAFRHLITSSEDIPPACLSIASSLRVDGIVISFVSTGWVSVWVCVCVCASPFSQCQHHISHNMFNVLVFASLLLPPPIRLCRLLMAMIEMLQIRRANTSTNTFAHRHLQRCGRAHRHTHTNPSNKRWKCENVESKTKN